jgi:preprotein translocase subunit YajC
VWNADGVDTVNLKKILTFAGIALLLFFLIAEPQQAAQLVTNILNSLRTAAEALITFVRQLF